MSGKRRPNGEGCLIRHSNGTVSLRITLGKDSNGRMKTKTFTGKNYNEAKKKMDAFKKKQIFLSQKIVSM